MPDQTIVPADELHVWVEHDQQAIYLHYKIDKNFGGTLKIRTPLSVQNAEEQLVYLFGTCGAIFLAQLCLAGQIYLNFPSSQDLIDTLSPTIQSLYAVRAYRDGILPMPKPVFIISPLSNGKKISYPNNHLPLISQRAVTMWSGGLDSTLSMILLSRNNYQAIPLHVAYTNIDAAESELQAVKMLSVALETPFETVEITFEQFLDIAASYSKYARGYPDVNSVPHGRELILLPVALMYALRCEASNVCFGFENSTWTEQFSFDGQQYHRYDTQSESGNLNLQAMIHKFVDSRISLFSPVAPITEYRKFKIMVTNFPELAQKASFCFWGQSCGLCNKCAMYYLFQRSLGLEVIQFKHNPLLGPAPFIKQAMQNWDKPTSRESNFALAQIVANNDVRIGEESLAEYKRSIFPQIQPVLETWRSSLMATHPAALLPASFTIPF